jgi:hypothetical protein
VPRRPGGGVSPPDSIEAGLRDLVLDPGPDIRKLSRGDSEGLKKIMRTAHAPVAWPQDAKAAAILTLIQDLVEQTQNPRWKAAALAAFRLPSDRYMGPQFDSLASRWRAVTQAEGLSGSEVKKRAEAYRGYWITAAGHLARELERALQGLNQSAHGWEKYRSNPPPSPPRSLPISFDRTDVLYRFVGNRGIQSISYRWLTAHANVDHYEAVGWYYNEPDAPVEIVPLANCILDGPLRDLPQGGRCATLKFSHTLKAGEQYFFAYMTNFNSEQPCRPTILYEVRGLEMRALTLRAQFDLAAKPRRCWYFDVEGQSEGWSIPDDNAPELLHIAPNGYVEHEFSHCERGRKYGLRWQWD